MPVAQFARLDDGPRSTTLYGGAFEKHEQIQVLTAARTVTENDSGTLFICNLAASLTIALPAIESVDRGFNCTFYYQTTVAGGDSVITAQTGDLLLAAGKVTNWDTDSSNVAAFYAPDGADDLITTFNGSTKGGLLGSWIRYVAIHGTGWLVKGEVFATGNPATPFS